MNRLEEWRMLAQRRRGLQAHRTCDARSLVCQNVAKGILRDDNVKETRLCKHSHRGIINKHII